LGILGRQGIWKKRQGKEAPRGLLSRDGKEELTREGRGGGGVKTPPGKGGKSPTQLAAGRGTPRNGKGLWGPTQFAKKGKSSGGGI